MASTPTLVNASRYPQVCQFRRTRLAGSKVDPLALTRSLRSSFTSLSGVRRAAQTTDFLDLDGVEHRYGSLPLAPHLGGRISALPPERPFLQKGADSLSAFLIFACVRNFRILPEDNHARPIVVAANFVCLHADQRIFPHPFNLLPQRGKAAQVVYVEHKINRDDVRPIITGASEPAIAEPGQNLATFPASNLCDYHCVFKACLPT
jgi:hypothetical protein